MEKIHEKNEDRELQKRIIHSLIPSELDHILGTEENYLFKPTTQQKNYNKNTKKPENHETTGIRNTQ